VRATGQRTRAVEAGLTDMGRQVSALNGQIQATVAEGGALTLALRQVDALQLRVNAFDLERFVPTQTRVADIDGQVLQLGERLALLENR
jgi:hypothetical protein